MDLPRLTNIIPCFEITKKKICENNNILLNIIEILYYFKIKEELINNLIILYIKFITGIELIKSDNNSEYIKIKFIILKTNYCVFFIEKTRTDMHIVINKTFELCDKNIKYSKILASISFDCYLDCIFTDSIDLEKYNQLIISDYNLLDYIHAPAPALLPPPPLSSCLRTSYESEEDSSYEEDSYDDY